MGIELAEGRDLLVQDGLVMMRTTRGFQRVDVIYRRIDDDFIDPECFRQDSVLGVTDLIRVYQEGRVALANAPGTGVADDKVVYAYVPAMIRCYLEEEPILPNVPTYQCWEEEDCKSVLAHLDALGVKATNESGGYGILVGPHATSQQRLEFARHIEENPRNNIAQPRIKCPSWSRTSRRERQHDRIMLSRSAESLYWLSRYVELEENIARFIDVNLHLNLDVTADIGDQWEPLVRVTGDWDTFVERYGTANRENVI
jgi:uncharacterized circularly permuted ATP-grasp superfamily protein